MVKRVIIVGGGISGLAAAYYLQQYAPSTTAVTLIDSAHRLGGKVATAREDDFVIEGGPDSFLAQKVTTLDLCRALGLEGQFVSSNVTEHPTYVWSEGRLQAMPEGMMLMTPTMILPFLRSSLISWPGKLRMSMEPFISVRNTDEDESLASFVRRRLGSEALEKIAAPLMAGIYAANPENLSLQSTFPLFLDIEKKYGSLLYGMLAKKRTQAKEINITAKKSRSQSQHRSMFMTLHGGLQELIDALEAQLNSEDILLNRRVLSVTHMHDQYEVVLEDGLRLAADDVVFSTPAYVTADVLQAIDPLLASRLRAIRYVSTATVSLGFQRKDISHPLDGFGFVVPRTERRKITACSWSSAKFNHRAPKDKTLIRVFIGGASAEHLAEMTEEELVGLAREELRITMGITAAPLLAKAYRWRKANPQYEVGHATRIAEIDSMMSVHNGLYLAGAAYHGAGIPDCIQSGERVAMSIAKKYSMERNEPMTWSSRRIFMSKNEEVHLIPNVSTTTTAHPIAIRDYAKNPMLVYWETTQACALACLHCRAEAITTPRAGELTREEGKRLLQQIASFDRPLPHLVLTGGDPLQRADIFELIDEAKALGITVSITPSVTRELSIEKIRRLQQHGIESLGLSLDGSNTVRHEAVRGVEGCFDWTMRALDDAAALDISVQVNTLVSEETVDDLPAIYELLKTKKIMRWSLFFLIAVGRGKLLQPISAEHGEELMHWIYDLAKEAPFAIKTTEAPSYRRVALNRMREEGMQSSEIQNTPVYRGFGIRDGHGILFISSQGDIYPAGFLPLPLGNVRASHAVDVYRNAPMFRAFHSPEKFKGKCGYCEYRALCGGSRARAFATTGDALASDPFCPYQPAATAG